MKQPTPDIEQDSNPTNISCNIIDAGLSSVIDLTGLDPYNTVIKATCRKDGPENMLTVIMPSAQDVEVTVVYTLTLASWAKLLMPYVFSVNGEIPTDFENTFGRWLLLKNVAVPMPIKIKAKTGDTVALHLGADARPGRRSVPLYSVQVGESPIIVNIQEKMGKASFEEGACYDKYADDTDQYQAYLTGAVWMQISHRYTPEEALELLPPDTTEAIAKAVCSIYSGLSRPRLVCEIPLITGDVRRITIDFENSENPRQNIVDYELLRDGVTRVHPAGYAALFEAALQENVSSIGISSCWRPMYGSILHRLGLGLDVNFLNEIRLNREELTENKPGISGSLVSEEEKRLFRDFEKTQKEFDNKELLWNKTLSSLNKIKKKTEADQKAIAELKDQIYKEEIMIKQDLYRKREAWNAERNKNEPYFVRVFRNKLTHCNCVRAVFDPWYMDSNTQDNQEPVPNEQITQNEKTHATHFHITVDDDYFKF